MSEAIIAVVDDDRSVVKSVARLLSANGYAVRSFTSVGDFLTALPDFKPQCLVLDVHMPGMTGFELQDQLHALGYCVPVIFMTAHDTPQTRERARRIGCFGFFLKPFKNDLLLRSIQEAVNCQNTDQSDCG